MNSETRTWYGSRVRRQGRSRPWRRNQRSSRRRNSAAVAGLGVARTGVDLGAMGGEDRGRSGSRPCARRLAAEARVADRPPCHATRSVRVMATEVLALPRLVGRWFLNATSHVGRVALMVADLVRSLNEVRIWLPRTLAEAWNI